MDEHELSKEHMDSLKALALTNIKIGEAKGTLLKLQEQETSYLEEREKKALSRIQKVYDDSKELLVEAQANYSKIKELLGTVTSFSDFLTKAYDSFMEMLKDFREKNDLWDHQVSTIEEGFSKIRQEIDSDKVRIKNDQEALDRAKRNLAVEQRKIVSDRGELERAIIRLKEGRI